MQESPVPPWQRYIARELCISQSSVSRIIKQTNFVLRKLQKLTKGNADKRRQCARQLYRSLAVGSVFVRTDESWFYLSGSEGKRKICYIKRSDPDYGRIIIQQHSSRSKDFLVWVGAASKGKTAFRFVESGAKANADLLH
ncbi:unnamed protein product [Didymodactylos carnosus]|uniref:Uncharacterized protein n=1 Tax=Didymodactylos carnosus TaxID=1234261 RepID=A0A815U9L0_9BILA|nr:unnamed protein product [Didymodactylos carnosus]CAF1514673.1 unnamed protein product [Didymodactylos carnosus]CAF4242580.1 unnamed protein product [Didymodactylos carnosus]CAF4374820.1 unnamed protein product [Didymodactylos carnosus]